MNRRFIAVALITLSAAVPITGAFADPQSAVVEPRSFTSLQGIDVQALSKEDMQLIAGRLGDTNLVADLISRDPAAVVTLADLLINGLTTRGIPVPAAVQKVREAAAQKVRESTP